MANDYYQSVHTGAQIDDAVGRIVNGEIGQLAADAEAAGNEAKAALEGIQTAIENIPEGDTPIVNDLTTGGSTSALSAAMGKYLKSLLDKHWFGQGTAISSGADLNTYTTLGKYYANSNAIAKTMVNGPEGLAANFALFVFKRTSNNAITQMIITLDNDLYIRSASENGDFRSWGEKANLSVVKTLIAATIAKTDKPFGSYTGNGDATTRTIDTGVISELNNAVLIRRSGGKSFVIATASGFIGKDESDVVCAGTGASFGGASGIITLMAVDITLNASGETYCWHCL